MSDLAQKNLVAPTNGRDIEDLHTPPMRLQFGPSHPSTHGTVKITIDLEGERIVYADVEVGYLHRGFEKECETGYYYQNIPYTDRLNYSSPILNNVGYCMAVEKLFDDQDAAAMRLHPHDCAANCRGMADHMLCVGAAAMELAAYTPMLYLIEARELVLDQIDALCGGRVTSNFVRIGGVSADMPEGFKAFSTAKLDQAIKLVDDTNKLLTENPVFRRRMEGTGYHVRRRPDCLGRHRSAVARGRRALRYAPHAAVSRLRRRRFRRAGRRA